MFIQYDYGNAFLPYIFIFGNYEENFYENMLTNPQHYDKIASYREVVVWVQTTESNLCVLQEIYLKKNSLLLLDINQELQSVELKTAHCHFLQKKLAECAKILDTTVDYLINGSTQLNLSVSDQSHVFKIPIYESVSAGFGTYTNDSIIGYEDVYVDNPADVPDLMFIKVHGDSMEPKIEDGDLIQVRRQTSIDSGDFGVVLVDNMDGFVKKVIYGSTWIELRSLNPKYAPMKFKNAEVTRIRVIGKVLKVTKTL